jgi:DNA-binding NtrC family response regulator
MTMKILLIDDDAACLKHLACVLEMSKHKCQAFTAPEQALCAYAQQTFDAVITGMKMPGLNGVQVLQQIRALNPEAEVVIVTGNWDAESAIAAVNCGACAYLIKPLKLLDLMSVLKRLEQKIKERDMVRNDHARLAMEYARLKTAYEDLQASLSKNRGSEDAT